MTHSLVRAAAIAGAALLLAAPSVISAAPGAANRAQNGAGVTMTFAALEQHALKLGIRPSELKIKRGIAEIEGWDANNRKVELTLNSRSGEVLNREFDD